jgi:hypothetical protein
MMIAMGGGGETNAWVACHSLAGAAEQGGRCRGRRGNGGEGQVAVAMHRNKRHVGINIVRSHRRDQVHGIRSIGTRKGNVRRKRKALTQMRKTEMVER